MARVVGVQGDSNLMEIVGALEAIPAGADSLNSRDQDGHENGDYGDHDQQFNKTEGWSASQRFEGDFHVLPLAQIIHLILRRAGLQTRSQNV
jgi:hypothetical protein